MKSVIIDHTIEKSREGSYYTIPFEVPDGVEQMTIHYRYSRDGKPANVVDLGLSDSNGKFLGWSGSARQEITVGRYSATPGYWMTNILPGSWSILVGAYKIPPQGLKVHYEISFAPPQPRWLAGDLHVHSTASDGANSAYALALRAKREGLDFLAIADHNNYCENFHLPVLPGLTMIPAVEWTHYRGHINLFGIPAPFENSFVANSLEEMQKLLNHVRSNGALVSVNHPKCPLCPYQWKDDSCFDMMEVWNGPMRQANLDAVSWWHSLLMDGRKIPIVGGSDFHRDRGPVRFAHPVTFVYAASSAREDICLALSLGKSYITSSVKGIRLHVEDGMFGDTVAPQPGRKWRFTAQKGKFGQVLRLITNQGIAAQKAFDLAGNAEITIEEGAWRFAYLEAGYPLQNKLFIRAISNPIYIQTK